MDRRGFLRNILGSLAAASLPIPAAKPLAKKPEIAFKVTDLTGYTRIRRDLLADNYVAADKLIQELFAREMRKKHEQWQEDFFVRGIGLPRVEYGVIQG